MGPSKSSLHLFVEDGPTRHSRPKLLLVGQSLSSGRISRKLEDALPLGSFHFVPALA